MKAIGKYLILFTLTCSQVVFAQVKFEAVVNKASVAQNEMLRVDFSMNGDGDNFQPPRFEGFQIAAGPNQSVNYSMINGLRSFSKSYSYFLVPTRKGKLSIGAASIEIENKLYKTEPITVTVTDAIKREEPQMSDAQQQMLKGIHVVTEVSNSNPYINEPITVTHKLYVGFNSSVRGFTESSSPKYNKFWNHPIDLQQQKVEQGNFQGQPYRFIVLRKSVLMPQESGNLEIEPMVLDIETELPTGRRDFFGYAEMGVVRKVFSSGKKKIKVKPLPEAGKPADFSGAVGQFTFKVNPSTKALKSGEPLTLTVTVEGKGNLNLFSLPQPIAPPALEIYDPISAENISPGTSGLQGSKTDKYTIIPQYKGDYQIKPLEFSYFDLASKSYKTITSDPIPIEVLDGPMLPTNEEVNKTEKTADVEKFYDLKTITAFEAKKHADFLGSPWFYALLIAPLLAMPLFAFTVAQRRKKQGDWQQNKRRQNNRLARKYLGEAKKNLRDKEAFYEALERCLHNFLKAKLRMETSEMSNDNIEELLAEKGIDTATTAEFMNLKFACEFARYAPTAQIEMDAHYQQAIGVISELEKQFK
ncbi:BatD family protein [Flavobacterium sp. JP2137]|uniref:BatD family protein n=1 Tax=Flavobacterium sp. JP2137 TaxID=3414510 RepID=UPI003D2FFA25